jgi:hypothetical protein
VIFTFRKKTVNKETQQAALLFTGFFIA